MSSLLARPVSHIPILFVLAGLVAACGHEPIRHSPGAARHSPVRSAGEQAAIVAASQVGVPYRYGGATPSGFDCSGLAQYAYAKAGRRIPRTTGGQWRQLSPVSKSRLAVGDLLFFRIEGKVSHVGLYLGGGRFVHAPSSGRTVTIEYLASDFYRRALVRGGRAN